MQEETNINSVAMVEYKEKSSYKKYLTKLNIYLREIRKYGMSILKFISYFGFNL